jgi:hypothetical protein
MPRNRTLCRLDSKMRPGTDFWTLLLPSRYSSSYRRYFGLILAPTCSFPPLQRYQLDSGVHECDATTPSLHVFQFIRRHS